MAAARSSPSVIKVTTGSNTSGSSENPLAETVGAQTTLLVTESITTVAAMKPPTSEDALAVASITRGVPRSRSTLSLTSRRGELSVADNPTAMRMGSGSGTVHASGAIGYRGVICMGHGRGALLGQPYA